MDPFTAWAGLLYLEIATVALICIWRAIIYVFDLVEAGAEKGLDFAIGKVKER